jgi:hypothetical protein
LNQAWCFTPVIPALRKLRQEDLKCEASLGYIMSSYVDKGKTNKSNRKEVPVARLASIGKGMKREADREKLRVCRESGDKGCPHPFGVPQEALAL